MTVEELIERLAEFNPEAEVRIASQPSWPMEYELSEVAPDSDIARPSLCPIVYLAEGRQIGYLPQEAAVTVGWSED